MASSLPRELRPAKSFSPWGFSKQEYWNWLPCPPLGDLPNPGIKPRSPTLQANSLPSESPGKPIYIPYIWYIYMYTIYIHTHIYIYTYTYTHICTCLFIYRIVNNLRASQLVLVVKNPPANAGVIRDAGLIPGSRRSPGGRHGNTLHYSCLENHMERGA